MMNNQNISVSSPVQSTDEQPVISSRPPVLPPEGNGHLLARLSPFWRDRLVEGGLVLSMMLYYLIHSPLLSLPFLLIFTLLSWYRLSFAIALLPLTLPYYLEAYQKTVVGSAMFSLTEIALSICVVVGL